MIKTLFVSILIFHGAILFGQNADVKRVSLDTEASTIEWVGKKVTGAHEGTVQIKSGSLLLLQGKSLVGGTFVIDMTSIACTDMKGGGAAKLVGHLSSDDFFDVESFPEAKLEISKAEALENNQVKFIADATIKGQTHPLEFVATVGDNTATADIVIDRTKYGIRYGSGSFFDNLGDRTIDDNFTLSVNLVY